MLAKTAWVVALSSKQMSFTVQVIEHKPIKMYGTVLSTNYLNEHTGS